MTKNIAVFVLVSAAILGGWIYLQTLLPPPRPPETKKDADAVAKSREAKADEAKKDIDAGKKPEVKKEEPKKDVEKAPAEVHAPPAPKVPERHFTLGDESSFLNVELTNRGAGVRRLTLTRFE